MQFNAQVVYGNDTCVRIDGEERGENGSWCSTVSVVEFRVQESRVGFFPPAARRRVERAVAIVRLFLPDMSLPLIPSFRRQQRLIDL